MALTPVQVTLWSQNQVQGPGARGHPRLLQISRLPEEDEPDREMALGLSQRQGPKGPAGQHRTLANPRAGSKHLFFR